jgi:hypothetical protein
MENTFAFHDQPAIDDQNVLKHFFLLQQIVTPVHELQLAIINHPTRQRLSFGVALPIINRSLEIVQSIVLLLSGNRVRDASVLFLNLYELKLDLRYIALDTSKADLWIDSAAKNKKPWRVKEQQKAIYTSTSDYDIEVKLYRDYSMIKHGNTAGSHESFRMSMKGTGMVLNIDPLEMIVPEIIHTASTLAVMSKSAIRMLEAEGISFEGLYEKIDEAYWNMRNDTSNTMEEIVYEWVFSRYQELREIPDIRKKLRIDIESSNNDEGLKIKVTRLKK